MFYFFRYEVDNFEEKVLQLYKELEPLYKELHAYIRRKLYEKYGEVRLSFLFFKNYL